MITQSPQTFMDELKRQAERYKDDPKNTKPENQGNEFFYRFGDWVYRMKPENLYIEIDGLVAVDDVDGKTVEEAAASPKKHVGVQIPEISPQYKAMKKIITDGNSNNYLDVARSWLTGRNEEVNVPEGMDAQRVQASQGQAAIAMFLSESIRNFRTHVTNMMGVDLHSHQMLSWGQFWNSQPMAAWLMVFVLMWEWNFREGTPRWLQK